MCKLCEIKAKVSQDLALKLQLEVRLAADMRRIFKGISKEVRQHVAVSSSTPKASDYLIEIEGALRTHYRRIVKSFAWNLRESLEKSFGVQEAKALSDDEIAKRIEQYVKDRAEGQSLYITQTTQREIDEVVGLVLAASIGMNVSQEAIALAAEREFFARAAARADIIGATETSAAAEGIKYLEASTLAKQDEPVGGVDLKKEMVKQWDSILDEKTRLNHAVADGQRRHIDDPFDVGGQKLMVPGDTSLGATLDNIINCRCSVQYVIGKPTVL